MRATDSRAALAAVIAEGLFGRLAFGVVSFALPLYALSLGLSLAEIGLLVSLRALVLLPLKPVAGWLADRVGVRAVYLGGGGARVVAAGLLFVAGDFAALAIVRLLQGASAAGRDVASLGVIARDAEQRVAAVYGWYATAKHVGGVAGAGLAGVLITASGGGFVATFALVGLLSVVPLAIAWYAIQDVPVHSPPADSPPSVRDHGGVLALLRELRGPASVGLLVAASAYMVHGLFPVLATGYAGLDEAQAGAIYTLSAVVFLVASPAFGWLIDRYGRAVGLAWRSVANAASSLTYLLVPSFAGLAAARAIDDSGKAAFRPAWAAAIAELANAEPRRRVRRLAALDTAASAGEALGPALAGVLWQTGGIGLLFAGRIALAAAGELAALRVFGEGARQAAAVGRTWRRLANGVAVRLGIELAYLGPPTVSFAIIVLWLGIVSDWGNATILVVDLIVASGTLLAGLLLGALIGGHALAALRAEAERQRRDLAHDLRGRLTVARGEVELVMCRPEATVDDRRQSATAVITELNDIDALLRAGQNGRAAHARGSASTSLQKPDSRAKSGRADWDSNPGHED